MLKAKVPISWRYRTFVSQYPFVRLFKNKITLQLLIKVTVLLLFLNGYSQSITPSFVGAGGGSYSGNGVLLDVAIGEVAVETKESGGVILTEGNLQPRRPRLFIIGPSSACFQDSIRLSVSGGSRFSWSIEGQPEEILGVDTSYVFMFDDTETFLVKNNYGSEGMIQVSLKDLIECNFELIVYEYLSPNGDGDNDVFLIENIERSQDHEVYVYDKWGQEVYRSKKYLNDWKGSDLPNGAYVYVVKENDISITYKGKLIIER